jgi:hypothetical protein
VDRDDRVLLVEVAREHRANLGDLDVARVGAEGTRQIVGDVLALQRPFEQDLDVIGVLAQRNRQVAVAFEATPPLQRLLRVGLVLPEIWCGALGFELGQLTVQAGFVKAPSWRRRRVRRVPRRGEPVRRESWCLRG